MRMGTKTSLSLHRALSLPRPGDSIWGHPNFLKDPNVREIAYCMDGFRDRKTYVIWHNRLYAAGYGETRIGSDRRHCANHELEQIDRYVWNFVFETPTENRITAEGPMGAALPNPRIMAELLPNDTSFGHKDSATASNAEPGKNV